MSPILGIIASANQQGRGGGPESGYDSLATVTVPSGGLASVTFAGIPTGYKHLQLRYISLAPTATTYYSLLRFNGDTTTTNYRYHYITGNGSAASAGQAQNAYSGTYGSTTAPGVAIIDILDYSNTNKNKTTRELSGNDYNGAGEIFLISNLWMNTNAISTINLTINTGSYPQHSTFALYGIK